MPAVPAASTSLPPALSSLFCDPLDDGPSGEEEVEEVERDDCDEPEPDELLEEPDREVPAEPDDEFSVMFDKCLLPLRLPLPADSPLELEYFVVPFRVDGTL